MRTQYVTHAKDVLTKALENSEKLTAEEWVDIARDVLEDVRNTLLFARNNTSKGFVYSTTMSEEQVRETEQFKVLNSLSAGQGCTVNINPDLYRYIRWIIKRDNPLIRLRTIKLGDNILSVSRIK